LNVFLGSFTFLITDSEAGSRVEIAYVFTISKWRRTVDRWM